jgi:2-polyprenyl-3-methyl-5-hydroxy-6-metoxy-1,4-benzoquinol methylase
VDTDLYKKFYDVETKHWWFSARRKIVLDTVKNVIKLNKKSLVLDYGCGTGGILDLMSESYTAYGADMSGLAIEFCKKRDLKNIMSISDVLSNDEFKNKFDMITVLDVIEHIEDDLDALNSVRSLLKEDGYLFVTVPAYQFLYGPYDVLTQHKRRYSKKRLKKVLIDANFEIEKISYFNTFLSPLLIISRLISSKTGSDNDTDIPNKILNSILKKIFEIEKYFLRYISFPFGISIMCIAKKR